MIVLKCKCGRYTDNGFLCTSCQKDVTIDTLSYEPEATSDTESEDEIIEELDFLVEPTYSSYEEE